jgi:hypothetical protein
MSDEVVSAREALHGETPRSRGVINVMVDELGMRRPPWLRLLAGSLGVLLASACQFPGYSFSPEDSGAGSAGGSAGASSDGGSSGSGSVSGAGSQHADGGSTSSGSGGEFAAGGEGGVPGGGEGGEGGESTTGGGGGSGSLGCSGEEAFCDDFEDLIADGWSTSGGTWAVMEDDDGNDAFQGGGASEEALAGDGSWADQTVEARVRVVAFGGDSDTYRAGIVARYASSSAFYVFALGGDGTLTIRRSTGAPSGSSGTCAAVSTNIDPGEWFTLKLQVTGPSGNVRLRTYLNGTPVHDCTSTATTTASGKIGVLTVGSGTTARFDDVKVLLP